MRLTKTAPGNSCWNCGHVLTGATDPLGDKVPQEGNVSICVECASLGIFLADLSIRKPTLAEEEEIMKSPQARAYVLLIKAMWESKNG